MDCDPIRANRTGECDGFGQRFGTTPDKYDRPATGEEAQDGGSTNAAAGSGDDRREMRVGGVAHRKRRQGPRTTKDEGGGVKLRETKDSKKSAGRQCETTAFFGATRQSKFFPGDAARRTVGAVDREKTPNPVRSHGISENLPSPGMPYHGGSPCNPATQWPSVVSFSLSCPTVFDLSKKQALVTGAGSGIGQAMAHALARGGAQVWVVDRDETAGTTTVNQIRDSGGRAEFAHLDVAQAADALQLAQRLPGIDILVNNAGIGHVGSLLMTEAADLDRLYAVNVRGPFNLCKAFLPAMLERRYGSVINIASVGGVVAVRDRLAYTVTKHAVVGLTRALALDHSHTGVRCNAICPGRVETPFVQARIAEYPDPAEAYRQMSATQLTGRMARPEEIAAAAVYLASDEAAMVTGSCLMVDGGWTAGK